MNHKQFAVMKFENAEPMYINAQYITAYAYLREGKKTVVAVLGEGKEMYFPGDQTEEIKRALNYGRRSAGGGIKEGILPGQMTVEDFMSVLQDDR